jgi:hypothetical protein
MVCIFPKKTLLSKKKCLSLALPGPGRRTQVAFSFVRHNRYEAIEALAAG